MTPVTIQDLFHLLFFAALAKAANPDFYHSCSIDYGRYLKSFHESHIVIPLLTPPKCYTQIARDCSFNNEPTYEIRAKKLSATSEHLAHPRIEVTVKLMAHQFAFYLAEHHFKHKHANATRLYDRNPLMIITHNGEELHEEDYAESGIRTYHDPVSPTLPVYTLRHRAVDVEVQFNGFQLTVWAPRRLFGSQCGICSGRFTEANHTTVARKEDGTSQVVTSILDFHHLNLLHPYSSADACQLEAVGNNSAVNAECDWYGDQCRWDTKPFFNRWVPHQHSDICVSISLTSLVELEFNIRDGNGNTRLSYQGVLDCVVQKEKSTFIAKGLISSASSRLDPTRGLPLDKDYPPKWSGKLQKCNRDASPARLVTFAASKQYVVPQLTNLLRTHPISAGIAVPLSFHRYQGWPDYYEAQPDEPYAGKHALLVAGYRPVSENVVDFRVKNSWGDRWGAGGYAWFRVTPRNFERLEFGRNIGWVDYVQGGDAYTFCSSCRNRKFTYTLNSTALNQHLNHREDGDA